MQQVTHDSITSALPTNFLSVAEAMERVQMKDAAAFEMLYEYYKKPLGRCLTYLVSDREAAFDLYQDTFQEIWTRLPERGFIKNFEAWLYTIARRKAIDYLRHEKKIAYVSLPEEDSIKPGEYVLSGLISIVGPEDRTCEVMCIKQALEAMSVQCRTCVLLQDLWGYSQVEIAGFLEITVKTVSANVSRGRAQLRAAYAKLMNELNAGKGGQK
jgi:RNA polymerase sigma factor (sigma-70 family)